MFEALSNTRREGNVESDNSSNLIIRPLPTLSFGMKQLEYVKEEPKTIPFMIKCNRFDSLEDAMQFLFRHCRKYHGTIKRTLVQQYTSFIDIIDLANGGYRSMSTIEKKQFNKCYTKTKKLIINNL